MTQAAGANSVAVIVWHLAGNLESRFTDFLCRGDGWQSLTIPPGRSEAYRTDPALASAARPATKPANP